jgi:hypothetical protein
MKRSRTRASSFAVLAVALAFAAVGLAPSGASGAPGWRNCGDPGEGEVVFISDVKSRGVLCDRAVAFARSYEKKVIESPGTGFPDRHRGYRCFDRRVGVESDRFTCKRGTKRINFSLGV